ncbi:MAG: hypothetical protein AAFQ64_14710 [Pseudomonadota bacterium]
MRLRYWLFTFGSLMAASACGSDGETPVENPFSLATEDTETASNGIAFADVAVIEDYEGLSVTVPIATVDGGMTLGPANATLETTTVVPEASFFVDGPITYTIELEGEILSVTNTVGLLTDGRSWQSTRVLSGAESVIVGGILAGDDGFEQFALFPLAVETIPSAIFTGASAATYQGDFEVLGTSYVDGTQSEFALLFEGDAVLTVDLDAATLIGTLTSDPLEGTTAILTGALSESDIVGNGASGSVAWTCGDGANCSGTSDYGTVFAGDTGQEIVGLTTVDVAVDFDDPATDVTYVGVAGFLAGRN